MKLLSVGIAFDLSKVYNRINHQSSSCYDISCKFFAQARIPRFQRYQVRLETWTTTENNFVQEKFSLFHSIYNPGHFSLGNNGLFEHVCKVRWEISGSWFEWCLYTPRFSLDVSIIHEWHSIGRITVLHGFCNKPIPGKVIFFFLFQGNN